MDQPLQPDKLRVGFPNLYRCSGADNRIDAMAGAVFNLAGVERFNSASGDKPDVNILFGCVNRNEDYYRWALASYSAAKIIVAGCAANLKPEVVDWEGIKPEGTEVVVARQMEGESQTMAVLRALGYSPDQDKSHDLIVSSLLYSKELNQQTLDVGVGCPNGCKYCYRHSKLHEPVKSVPLDRTIACIDQVEQRGVRNLIIGGTNTAVYGMDYGESWLPELIRDVDGRGHFDSMEINNLAPMNTTPQLISTVNSCDVVSGVRIVVDHTND